MADMPSVVLIGRARYIVCQTEDIDESHNGLYERDEERIKIRKGLARHHGKTILAHETLHALLDRAGLAHRLAAFSDDGSLEEELVRGLSEWLTDFLMDNPEWIRYMVSDDSGT